MDAFIRSIGRTMIGWDEIPEGKPSQTAIVESRRGKDGANGVAIERAEFAFDGHEMSADAHPAKSSTKRNEFQNYRLIVE